MSNLSMYQAGLKVNYASLDQASEGIKNEANQLRAILDEIEAKIRHIAETSWQGAANSAFSEQMKNWEKEVFGVHSGLLRIAEAVRLSKDGYQETDMKSAKWFEDQGLISRH